MRHFKIRFLAVLFILTFSSCKDAELDQLMDEYCACLNTHKHDPEGRYVCIEIMQFIQQKYQNQPRKLNAVVEKTSDCY